MPLILNILTLIFNIFSKIASKITEASKDDNANKQSEEKAKVRRWILKAVENVERNNGATTHHIQKFLDSKEDEISKKIDFKLILQKLLDSGHLMKDGRRYFLVDKTVLMLRNKADKQSKEKAKVRRWILKAVKDVEGDNGATPHHIQKLLDSKEDGISMKIEWKLILKKLLDSCHLMKNGRSFVMNNPAAENALPGMEETKNGNGGNGGKNSSNIS
ncbi:hypothetical protein AVEN_230213-1 [Araneus ventricosus]|uniref:Uncharacterized protein n=1 Tax=Araneus ventricosus TaxID=182803 RepID=A0A4Y2DY89_ARAVE|nr:hypothetical protein AVEN_230213-1 [Araneus ventricosus]